MNFTLKHLESNLTENMSDKHTYFAMRALWESQACTRWRLLHQLLGSVETNLVYKVGDKVHVRSDDPRATYNIRATVTEVSNDGWGYHLRAFLKDLPGVHMFNMWDRELVPRTGKARLPFKRMKSWNRNG